MDDKTNKQLKYIDELIRKILIERPDLYGSIKLNFQNGKLVGTNILRTVLYGNS